MSIEKNTIWGFVVVSASAAACGSKPSSPPVDWSCGTTDVPYGSAYQCTSTDPRTLAVSVALGGSFTCPGGGPATTQCPPPAEDAPPPTEAGPPAEDTPPPIDAGSSMPEDASPPAKDAPPPVDAGSPTTPPPTTGGPPAGGDSGSGPPSGPPHGNPHGGPPGHGGGSCACDASGAPDSGEPPSETPPPDEAGTDGGSPPPFNCESDETETMCMQPPTCSAGTHPSACGACVPDDTLDDCVPPSSGGCWITGGGFIQPPSGQDSFGGNAMPMKSGAIRGEWENVDHGSGQQMHGQATYLYCRHVNEPGPGVPNGPHHDFTTNQAYFGGPARLFVNGAWSDGYWFDVVVDDHGEGKGANAGGPDLYHVTIRQMSASNQPGAIVYDGEGNLAGGNIQLHPPNNGHPFTSSTLPAWVALQP
jgi:hypothetical protein